MFFRTWRGTTERMNDLSVKIFAGKQEQTQSQQRQGKSEARGQNKLVSK